ncbi:biotin/lipoyl-binding protein [Paraclostridium sp. AKS73]|uniref:biotin/lipoyl-binding protein n=1 Tax=Paraclostridium sp. AKS73 TaxID=2876116 RepID=UPI0021E00974|nr:biotin/lipoyl-binding protein [Paraclostridium sp. AKS73]MCU9814414.1 biotin/lipoyl-binding protein [Paraclostridium sp. AKS73]
MKKSINLNKKKAIIGGVVVIAVFMVVFLGIKIKNNMSNVNETAQIPEIYTVPEKEKIIIDGKVMPGKSKDFFAEPSKGDIENIAVEDGQKVDQGQVLFTYKNENISPEIDNLKEQVTMKEDQLKVIQDEILKKSIEEEITKLMIR